MILAAGVRFAYVAGITGHDPVMQSDAIYYSAQADTIGQGRGFVDPWNLEDPAPRADHPPLTAIVATPATWLGNGTMFGQPITQVFQKFTMALVGVLTVGLIGLLGARVGGDVLGLGSAFVAALNPNLWVHDGLIMSESLGALTIAAVLYAAVRVWDRSTTLRWLALGVACGFAVLARSEAILMAPLLALPLIWRSDPTWKRKAINLGLFGAATAGVLAPWVIPNLTRFHEPVTLSTNDGLTLLGTNCDQAWKGDAAGLWVLSCIESVDSDGDAINDLDEMKAGTDRFNSSFDPSIPSAVYREAGLKYLRTHLTEFPDLAALRVMRMWGLYRPSQMADYGEGEYRRYEISMAGWALTLVSLPFVAVGLWAMKQARRPIWPFVCQAVAATATAALFYGLWRFRIGWDVAACVVATAGLLAIPKVFEQSRRVRTTDLGHSHGDFPNLDAYRAIGMILVMLAHVGFSSGLQFRSELGRWFVRFDFGLPVFFIISGFLLYRPYVERLLRGREPAPTKQFLRRRAVRVFPGYWAALILIMLIWGLQLSNAKGELVRGIPSISQFLQMATLTHTRSARTGFEGISQAWSLGIEMGFYLCLPFAATWLHRRLRGRDARQNVKTLMIACAGLYLASEIWRWTLMLTQPGWVRSAVFWFPTHMDFFAIGMGMAVLSAAVANSVIELPKPIEWLSRRPWLCWLIALGVWLLVVNPFEFENPVTSIFGGIPALLVPNREYAARYFMYGIAGTFFLIPAVYGNQHVGTIRTFLQSKPMVFLGTVSFGFYLWHLLWLERVEHWLKAKPFSGPTITLAVLTFVLTLPTAILSFYLVEKPAMALKNPRPKRGKPVRDSAVPVSVGSSGR